MSQEQKPVEEAVREVLGRTEIYHLNCEVISKTVTIATPLAAEKGNGDHYSGDVILLIPNTSTTEFARFMAAYYGEEFKGQESLPSGIDEFICMIPYPFNKYTRITFDYETKLQSGFYFLVNSEYAEEKLRANKIGEFIEISIYPEGTDLDKELEI